MKNQKLKPCPFCGEKEDISLKYKMYHGAPLTVNGNKFWFVECLPCDVRTGDCFDLDAPILGYKNGKEMAISTWNRRVSCDNKKQNMNEVHKIIKNLNNSEKKR
jgi:Lar family restriction alleviation protein